MPTNLAQPADRRGANLGWMTGLTIAEQLVLVAYDPQRRRVTGGPTVYQAAAGAVVMDLFLAGACEMRDGHLVTAAETPAGGPLLAAAAATIAAEPRLREIKHWVRHLAAPRFRPGQPVLASLVSAGVLRPVTLPWLGVFKRQGHELADQGTRDQLVAGVRSALLSSAIPDAPMASLLALLSTCGLVDRAVSREERGPARKRAASIARGDVVGEAVSAVIREVQAEVMTAVIVATMASSTVDGGGGAGHAH